FIADTRYGWRGYNIARWGSRLLRRMQYMVSLVTTDSFAKEVKLFGLGQYFIDRYRLIAKTFYDTQRSQLVRRYMTGFALGNLTTIVSSFTYLYIALQAIAGRLSIGALVAYAQAATSVPARPPCSSSSAGSTTRPRAGSSSTASTSATSTPVTCAARSAPCFRTMSTTKRPRPRTSGWAMSRKSPTVRPWSARASRRVRTS